jgi:hypothetical protein
MVSLGSRDPSEIPDFVSLEDRERIEAEIDE